MLKLNRSNQTVSSRLIRWVDWLLLFEFELILAPGRVLGYADYLSGQPSEIKANVVNSENLWNDWFSVNTITKLDAISENVVTPLETPEACLIRY